MKEEDNREKKTLPKPNKLKQILVSVLVALAFTGIIVGSTYAYWEEQANVTQKFEINIAEYNPSEQYIIFVGLDDSGNFVDDAAATAYAVVGYTGLVSELDIPSTHNGKNVTKILVHKDHIEDRLAENPIITKMTIPSTVVYIGAGACAQMTALTEVVIEGNTPLAIGDMAFAGCVALTVFENQRTTSGNMDSYFAGTSVPH